MGEAISSFVQDALGITNGAFGINAEEMLIQIASTILLFLVVRFFFWNKVTDYLEGRKAEMKQEYEDAQKANEDATNMKIDIENELQELRLSAKGVIDDAKERGESERKTILQKAKVDADKLVTDAQKEIDSNIMKARNSMNEEIVTVATAMAEKIIKKELDTSKHKELIEEATKEVLN